VSPPEPTVEAPRLSRSALAARYPSIAASSGVFVVVLLAFLAIGAALPVLPGYVRGPLHSGTSPLASSSAALPSPQSSADRWPGARPIAAAAGWCW
jgi:hypothetical protein